MRKSWAKMAGVLGFGFWVLGWTLLTWSVGYADEQAAKGNEAAQHSVNAPTIVTIMGKVRKPGSYTVKPSEQRRALEWLAQAELLPSADKSHVQLLRGKEWVRVLNLSEANAADNIVVIPGDVLFVPEFLTGTKPLLSLEVSDAPIADVLQLIARQANVNIVFDKNALRGTVTAKFRDKSVDQVLKYLLSLKDYQYRMIGDTYIVEPRTNDSARAAQLQAEMETLRARLAQVTTAQAEEVARAQAKKAEGEAVQAEKLAQAHAELAQAKASLLATSPEVETARAAMRQAEAALKNAEAQLLEQRADVDIVAAQLKEAEERLCEVQERYKAGTATQAEVRQAGSAVEVAKANYERRKVAVTVTQLRVEQARVELATAKAELELMQAVAARLTLPGVGVVSEAQLLVPAAPLGKQVNLSAKDAKLEEVIRKLSEQAGIPITLHESVPKDLQVSNVTLYGVTLAEALHLLLQQAGLRAAPIADRKGIVIVPPNRVELKSSTAPSARLTTSLNLGYFRNAHQVTAPLSDLVAQPKQDEQRTLNALYSATTAPARLAERDFLTAYTQVARTSASACSKCKTPLQHDWLFCPKCGAKNEQTPAKDWKFCPTCGKALSAGAGSTTRTMKK